VFLRLREIAQDCGFTNKLERLLSQTPVLKFIEEGGQCQNNSGPACIAETTCSNGRGQASSGCAPAR
jgi:hypothetical protein